MTASLKSTSHELVDAKQRLRAMAIRLLAPLVRLAGKAPGVRALARKIFAGHPGLKLRLSKVADASSSSARAASRAVTKGRSRFALSESENEAYAFLKRCRQTKGKVS
jgi:hypothetical protein